MGTSVYLILVLVSLIPFSNSVAQKQNITLGVMLPWTGSWPVGKLLGSAALIAIDDINNNQYLLPNHHLQFEWRDCKCNGRDGVGATSELLQSGVDAFIGPYCSDGCIPAGHLATFYNVPMISYSCSASDLSDKNKYPTFARTESFARTDPKAITINFVQLIKRFKWRLCSLIVESIDAWRLLGEYMQDELPDYKIKIAEYITFKEKEDNHEEILGRAAKNARIIVILGYSLETAKFLAMAHKTGMMDGEHVFITFDLQIKASWNGAYWMHGRNISTVFHGFLDLSVASPQSTSAGYGNFSANVRRRMQESPFFYTLKSNEKVDQSSAYLYDAVYLYAQALNKTLAAGFKKNNTQQIMNHIFNASFNGPSGFVGIDEKGNRIPTHELRNYQHGESVLLMSYNRVTNQLTIHNDQSIAWPGNVADPPNDRGGCGGPGQVRCIQPEDEENDNTVSVSVSASVSGFLVVALIISSVMLYRRRKYEQDLLAKSFFIQFEDVSSNMAKGQFGKGALARLMSRAYSICLGNDEASERNRHLGRYMGAEVYIKMISRPSVHITREHLLEIKKVRDLRHANLNAAVGVCTQAPHVCILWSFCHKGSLQDVLRNEDIKLDKMFKMSFIFDIVDGLCELHRSEIDCHGNFKSTNIVIDNRWVCKITDFGFEKFRCERKYSMLSGYQRSIRNLYTSPEHMNDAGRSQAGDIYSLGIVMSEIFTRREPFSEYELSHDEIISRVAQRFKPATRPYQYESFCDEKLISIIRMCWDDAPHVRPNCDMLQVTLRNYHGERRGNLVENMIELMEKYTDNLEELVKKRTLQLAEEKERTEELLYKMLPRSIAEQLKSGSHVTAESFDSVSIYFSDIVGFTSLAAVSTPMQVVALLNDLYTAFDAVVDAYDAYKVETIGDAYMVVSGLPQRNGIKHAGEIATMCLDLLHVVKSFTIRHIPDRQLQLRIGIHTGPCVAGVVGVKMPRYCLFGDTVNYASRMESTGLALRVHVSPECKETLDKLGGYNLKERGPVSMKGKGTITTYFLEGKDGYTNSLPDLTLSAPLSEHEFK